MTNVNEKLQISEEINDLEFVLNTGETGVMEYSTDVINGELNAVLISAFEPVSIKISMDRFPEIVLFEDVNFKGTKYFPLRVQAKATENKEFFTFGVEKWSLNDNLIINLAGKANTEVILIFRM